MRGLRGYGKRFQLRSKSSGKPTRLPEAGTNDRLTILKDPSGCYVQNEVGSVKTRVETKSSLDGMLGPGGSHGDQEDQIDLSCSWK